MPQVLAFVAQIGATIKAAFVTYLGTTVGTAVYSALVNYAFSSIISALTGGKNPVGDQQQREINYRGGNNDELVVIGQSRRGGTVYMYQNATVGGVKYIYVGLLINCFHTIKSIDNVYIGDKDENHPDFSDVELAIKTIWFWGEELPLYDVNVTGYGADGVKKVKGSDGQIYNAQIPNISVGVNPVGDLSGAWGLSSVGSISIHFEGVDYSENYTGQNSQAFRDNFIDQLADDSDYSIKKVQFTTKAEDADSIFYSSTKPEFKNLPENLPTSTPLFGINIQKNSAETSGDWDFILSQSNIETTINTHVSENEGHAITKEYIRVTRSLGHETEANILLLNELKDNPTAKYEFDETHIGRERPRVDIRFEAEWLKINIGAVPNILMDIQGHNNLIDPRTSNKGYSTNPAVVSYNAFIDDDIYATDKADLPLDVWKSEANICDEQVQILADGTTQKRYECHGEYSYSWQPADVFTVISNSCDGKFIEQGHNLIIRVGTIRTPVFHITQDHIEGGFNYQASQPLSVKSNRISGTYINSKRDFSQTSYPQIIIDDGLESKSKTINFDSEIDPFRAQRLALIALLKSLNATPINFVLRPLNLEEDSIMAGNYVTLDNEYLGIDKNIKWEVMARNFRVDGSSLVTLERRDDYIHDYDYSKNNIVEDAIPQSFTVNRNNLLQDLLNDN